MAARFEFIFSPGSLDGFPAIYYGSVRVKPRDVAAMQRAIYGKMPTITVINMADVLEIVQQVVDQIALVVRFVSAFTIVAGAIILASSVAGTRFGRVREVVILKTLGATRRRVAGIFSMEFLVLGAAAGLLGSALATGFTALVVKRLLKADFHFDPAADLFSIALTALVAVAAGWLASYRILGQKPLEVLRDECPPFWGSPPGLRGSSRTRRGPTWTSARRTGVLPHALTQLAQNEKTKRHCAGKPVPPVSAFAARARATFHERAERRPAARTKRGGAAARRAPHAALHGAGRKHAALPDRKCRSGGRRLSAARQAGG